VWTPWATPSALSVMGFFEIGSHELFVWAGFELWSSWSLPPEWLRLPVWVTGAWLPSNIFKYKSRFFLFSQMTLYFFFLICEMGIRPTWQAYWGTHDSMKYFSIVSGTCCLTMVAFAWCGGACLSP
jgi:hypothetical protein